MDATATPRFANDRRLVSLLFFVACPVAIAFPMGWYHAGLGQFMPVAASCGLWVSQWLISWWASEILLHAGKALFKPWHLPFVALLIVAALANMVLSRFWGPLINTLFLDLSGVEDQSINGYSRSLLDLGYVGQLFRASAYGAVYWCVLRYLYERYSGRARFSDGIRTEGIGTDGTRIGRIAPLAGGSEPAAAWPPRLGNDLRKGGITDLDGIVALQAEDHYIRVHLDDGSSRLIYFRFADAIAELKPLEGMQVHRSFWVKRAAIVNSIHEGGKTRLLLAGGLVVPVSLKHQALLEFMLSR